MISPQESVEIVYHFCQDDIVNRENLVKAVKALIDNALKRWSERKMVADNISAVIAMFGQFIFEDNKFQVCPSGGQLNGKSSQSSTLLDHEHFCNRCNSLQASCNYDKAVDSIIRKRAKEQPETSITSPKKHCIP